MGYNNTGYDYFNLSGLNYTIDCINETHCYIEYDNHVAYYGDYGVDCNMTLPDQSDIPGYNVVFGTVLPIVCFTGILGIILTVIVLSRKNMCTSTNSYFISLAIADLGFLVILSTRFLESKLTHAQFYKFEVFFVYAQIFLHTFLLTSVWVTVMLAVERYIAICHPLRAISICTVKRSRIIILVIFFLSFYMRISNFFEFRVVELFNLCTNSQILYVETTEFGSNKAYKIAYAWTVDGIICAVIPFLSLFFLNIRLITEIRKSTKYLRYHLGNHSKVQTVVSTEQLKITMMLISIIVVFFVCQAPYVVVICFKNIYNYESVHMPESMHIIIYITMFLLGLKSSFNFIIYCWFSEKFWITFQRMFCLRNCLSKQPSRRKNHTVHSADQGVTNSIRKSSYLTKDTIC